MGAWQAILTRYTWPGKEWLQVVLCIGEPRLMVGG
jgi:hypothetical protein